MTAYALFVTLILGIIIGVIGTCAIGDQMDQRDQRRAKAAQKRKDGAAMDAAVALCSDELGATVVSTEVNQ